MIKRICFLCFGFILFANHLHAQDKAPLSIHKGNFTASIAYGVPSIIRTFLKLKTNRDKITIVGFGPLMFKADYMFLNKWSIGLNGAYNFSRISWMDGGYDTALHHIRDYEYGIEAEEISASLRGNYHFKRTKKIDAYVGLGLGYGRVTLGTYTLAPVNQFSVGYRIPRPLAFEGTVGCRYYFMKHMALFVDFGLGKSWLLYKKIFLPEAIIEGGLNIKI